MKLLDEIDALNEIQALLRSADTARLAVAFWGAGAIERLGLDRDRGQPHSQLHGQYGTFLRGGLCLRPDGFEPRREQSFFRFHHLGPGSDRADRAGRHHLGHEQ